MSNKGWGEDCQCCPNCHDVPCEGSVAMDWCDQQPCRCNEEPQTYDDALAQAAAEDADSEVRAMAARLEFYGVDRLCIAQRLISACPHLRPDNGCALPVGEVCPKPEGDPA